MHPPRITKSGVSLFFLLLLSFSCQTRPAPTESKPGANTTVEFSRAYFDFGKIAEGETVTYIFTFKNTGKENFVIKNIDSGCGCTTVSYDKAPLAPGKEGKIQIAFNSSGRYGKQYKEISIFANLSKGKVKLAFSADVE